MPARPIGARAWVLLVSYQSLHCSKGAVSSQWSCREPGTRVHLYWIWYAVTSSPR